MLIRHKLGELIVPAIVLAGCLLYWLHVQDARSVARRVPDGVIIFTVALTVLVVIRAFLFPTPPGGQIPKSNDAIAFDGRGFGKRALFVALCVGYFFAFSRLGFNLANLLFLLVAYPLAGLGVGWSIAGAAISTVVFYLLAQVMDFNVPLGPFGF